MPSKAAPTTEPRTASVGLRFTPSLKEALAELARADRRTLASYIELVLEEHVKANREGGLRLPGAKGKR
jgi:hypothetical protein